MTEFSNTRANDDARSLARLLERIASLEWEGPAAVAMLVETPRPHRHAVRDAVTVTEGKGFAGDHGRKSFYRGEYVPGREVSATAVEILEVMGADPSVVGDNLITRGVDLAALNEGDVLRIGDEVELRRSDRPHRPCATFRDRTSQEAFEAARRGYRGALFVVRRGGRIATGDVIRCLES